MVVKRKPRACIIGMYSRSAATVSARLPPASWKSTTVGLSAAEFRLLSMFLQAPRRVVSRDDLAAQERGGEQNAPGRRIDLLVSRLRQKLIVPGAEASLIATVRGVGYRFDVRSVEGAV